MSNSGLNGFNGVRSVAGRSRGWRYSLLLILLGAFGFLGLFPLVAFVVLLKCWGHLPSRAMW